MALVLATNSEASVDLNSGKVDLGPILGTWENTLGRDVYASWHIELGQDGANELDANAATFDFHVIMNADATPTGAVAVDTFFDEESSIKWATTFVNAGFNTKPFLIPDGWHVGIFVFSSNAADSTVGTRVKLVDTQAGIDVRAVGGTTPLTAADISSGGRYGF